MEFIAFIIWWIECVHTTWGEHVRDEKKMVRNGVSSIFMLSLKKAIRVSSINKVTPTSMWGLYHFWLDITFFFLTCWLGLRLLFFKLHNVGQAHPSLNKGQWLNVYIMHEQAD
jgi:hypothetical protein